MRTLNISLPDSMRTFIDRQVDKGGYGTASEYLRSLIREAKKRQMEDRLEELLVEGMESGPGIEANPKYWAGKRARLRKGLRKKKSP